MSVFINEINLQKVWELISKDPNPNIPKSYPEFIRVLLEPACTDDSVRRIREEETKRVRKDTDASQPDSPLLRFLSKSPETLLRRTKEELNKLASGASNPNGGACLFAGQLFTLCEAEVRSSCLRFFSSLSDPDSLAQALHKCRRDSRWFLTEDEEAAFDNCQNDTASFFFRFLQYAFTHLSESPALRCQNVYEATQVMYTDEIARLTTYQSIMEYNSEAALNLADFISEQANADRTRYYELLEGAPRSTVYYRIPEFFRQKSKNPDPEALEALRLECNIPQFDEVIRAYQRYQQKKLESLELFRRNAQSALGCWNIAFKLRENLAPTAESREKSYLSFIRKEDLAPLKASLRSRMDSLEKDLRDGCYPDLAAISPVSDDMDSQLVYYSYKLLYSLALEGFGPAYNSLSVLLYNGFVRLTPGLQAGDILHYGEVRSRHLAPILSDSDEVSSLDLQGIYTALAFLRGDPWAVSNKGSELSKKYVSGELTDEKARMLLKSIVESYIGLPKKPKWFREFLPVFLADESFSPLNLPEEEEYPLAREAANPMAELSDILARLRQWEEKNKCSAVEAIEKLL